jgi:CSLREA domain-containing protein
MKNSEAPRASLTRIRSVLLVCGLWFAPGLVHAVDIPTSGSAVAAFAACQDGDVVKLTGFSPNDVITVSSNCVLDLNGFTFGASSIQIASTKKFTIRDSAPGNTGKLTASAFDGNRDRAGIRVPSDSELVIESGTVTAIGKTQNPGIGGEITGTAGTPNAGKITISGGIVTAYGGVVSGTPNAGGRGDLIVTSANFGAGIGGAGQGAGGIVTISGNADVLAVGGDGAAGIGASGGGGGGNGGTVDISGSAVVVARAGANGSSNGGAGIGGGSGSSGANVTVGGAARVTATGGITVTGTKFPAGAGIGGGSSGAGGSFLAKDDAVVTATGGLEAAGIGGGAFGGGGTFETRDRATVTATGGNPTNSTVCGTGIGGGRQAAGGTVIIGAGTDVTAIPGLCDEGVSAIGGSFGSAFGSLTVSGLLRLPTGNLRIKNSGTITDEVVINSTGVVTGTALDPTEGAQIVTDANDRGTILNNGSIQLKDERVRRDNGVVKNHHYEVTLDSQGGSTPPCPDGIAAPPCPVHAFAETFTKGARVLPSPTKPGLSFAGWYTQVNGGGTLVDANTALAGSADGTIGGNGKSVGVPITLYAKWSGPDLAITKMASASQVSIGDTVTFTLEVRNKNSADDVGGQISDTVPAAFRIDGVTQNGSQCTVNGQAVTCLLPTLAQNAMATVSIATTAQSAGTVTNTATVATAGNIDADTNDNSSAVQVTVNPDDPVVLAPTVNLDNTPGGISTVPFTITRNTTDVVLGPFTVTGPFSVSDDCDNVTLTSGNPTCTVTVTFSPTALGVQNGTLSYTSNGLPMSAVLTGAATGALIVNSLADPGTGGCNATECTLREAMAAANDLPGDDLITFDIPGGGTILPGSRLPAVANNGTLTIAGPTAAADAITLSGGPDDHSNNIRLMEVAENASLDISDLTLVNGLTGDPIMAGAIAVLNNGRLQVSRVRFINNKSTCGQGNCSGAVAVYLQGNLDVSDSVFSGNVALSSSGSGAAINFFRGGALKVARSLFADNVGQNLGGAISVVAATSVTVSNSTFRQNRGGGSFGGGAIFLEASQLPNLVNNTFSGNTAPGGGSGAVGVLRSAATLTNNLFTANTGSGGAAANCATFSGGSLVDGGGNIADDSSCSFSTSQVKTAAEIKLDTLKDNGGPAQTMALLQGSVAIDASGNCNSLTPSITTDQRGVLRPQPVGGPCDAGAFEAAQFALDVDVDGDGKVISDIGGIDCGDGGATCDRSFVERTQVTLTATPLAGNVFSGWSGACTGTSTCVVTMSQARSVTAEFTRQYTLTLLTNGGTGTGKVTGNVGGIDCTVGPTGCVATFNDGDDVILSFAPDAVSSTFPVFPVQCQDLPAQCRVTMDGDKTVTAAFVLAERALTLSATNGGFLCNDVACTATYPHGTALTLTADPSANYDFTAFGGDCTGTTCVLTMNADRSVSATFTLQQRTLTLSATNGGFLCNDIACTSTYPYGTLLTLTAVPDKGYDFTAFGDACGGTTCMLTIDADRSVTATFTQRQPTLTVNRTGSGAGMVSGTGIDCGADCTESVVPGTTITLVAAPAANADFAGFSANCVPVIGQPLQCTVTMDADKTVTATFTLKQRTLSLSAFNGSIRCNGAACAASYADGTTLTLTAVPNSGYAFLAFGGDCTGSSCVLTMNGARSVTATFTTSVPPPPEQRTLIVERVGNGAVTGSSISCGADCVEIVSAGSAIILTAIPAANADFVGFSGNCTVLAGQPSSCEVTLDASKTVTATFTAKPRDLTVNRLGTGTGLVTGSGIDCGTDCIERVLDGAVVTLIATPAANSSFSGFSSNCAAVVGQPLRCTVALDDSKTVQATFTLLPPPEPTQRTLNVDSAGSGSGTVTGTGIACGIDCVENVATGTVVTLTAVPAENSDFGAFSANCAPVSGQPLQCMVVLDQARTVTATFTLKLRELTVTRTGTGTGAVTGTGIDCGADCIESIDSGTVVTLRAAAEANSDFGGFSTNCIPVAGEPLQCTVTLDAATTVTVTFTLKQEGGGGGGGGGATGLDLLLAMLGLGLIRHRLRRRT